MVLGGVNNIRGEKYTMYQVARMVGCNLGRNKLIAFLREKQIIDKHNMPRQEYLYAGLIAYENKVIERTVRGYNSRQIYLSMEGIKWIEKLVEEDRNLNKS